MPSFRNNSNYYNINEIEMKRKDEQHKNVIIVIPERKIYTFDSFNSSYFLLFFLFTDFQIIAYSQECDWMRTTENSASHSVKIDELVQIINKNRRIMKKKKNKNEKRRVKSRFHVFEKVDLWYDWNQREHHWPLNIYIYRSEA